MKNMCYISNKNLSPSRSSRVIPRATVWSWGTDSECSAGSLLYYLVLVGKA